MINFETILNNLAAERPIFHSEADFQFALAWKIQETLPRASVRLEYRPPGFEKRIYVDIWVTIDNHQVAIELKYKTRAFQIERKQESFDLLDQNAQDCGRYDFLSDLSRTEKLVLSNFANEGIVLLITNDPLYWNSSIRKSTIDKAFRIHDSRTLSGHLSWPSDVNAATVKGRSNKIALKNSYELKWGEYSRCDEERFRQLFLRILSA